MSDPNTPPEGVDYWADDPQHPVAEWQIEVADGDTRQGYWAWVAVRRLLCADDD
jgi:hypothetical protein